MSTISLFQLYNLEGLDLLLKATEIPVYIILGDTFTDYHVMKTLYNYKREHRKTKVLLDVQFSFESFDTQDTISRKIKEIIWYLIEYGLDGIYTSSLEQCDKLIYCLMNLPEPYNNIWHFLCNEEQDDQLLQRLQLNTLEYPTSKFIRELNRISITDIIQSYQNEVEDSEHVGTNVVNEDVASEEHVEHIGTSEEHIGASEEHVSMSEEHVGTNVVNEDVASEDHVSAEIRKRLKIRINIQPI